MAVEVRVRLVQRAVSVLAGVVALASGCDGAEQAAASRTGAAAASPTPAAAREIGAETPLSEDFVLGAITTLGPAERASLRDRERLDAFVTDLAGLLSLARRAEDQGLDDDARIDARLELARARVLAAALIEADLARDVVTEDDLIASYQEGIDAFRPGARVRFRQIVVARRDLADELSARLAAGDAFEALAADFSEHPSASAGGQMGWHEVARLDPSLRDVVESLAVGERSGAVESDFGVHVIEIQERAEPPPAPFEAVRDIVERRVRNARRKAVTERLIEQERADIAGAVDPTLGDRLHAQLYGLERAEAPDVASAPTPEPDQDPTDESAAVP